MKAEQRNELLYQALETELGGVEIYTTALTCAVNENLKKEWQEYLARIIHEQREEGRKLYRTVRQRIMNMTNSDEVKKKEREPQATTGQQRGLRARGDGRLPTDVGATAKREKTFCEEGTITPRTGRAAPRVSWPVARNTRAKGNANGSRTSTRRVDCETMAATFKSCSRERIELRPAQLRCQRGDLGAQRMEEAHKPPRVPASERSWPQTSNRRGDRPAGRF